MEFNMSAKLKICGITRIDDARACIDAGVDWLGFNLFKKSPRYIPPEEASGIIDQLGGSVRSVAILVRPFRDEIIDIIAASHVNMIQVYEPQDFTDLSQFSVPSIICHRINPENLAAEYPSMNADMILFDSYSKDVLGGSGKKFNWNLIPSAVPKEKLILAGGITPQNIYEALNAVHPAVVDVASGAESAPGIKDITKIKSMVEKVKQYNENRK
jgi:phosphoribosylanthranilate isomerase